MAPVGYVRNRRTYDPEDTSSHPLPLSILQSHIKQTVAADVFAACLPLSVDLSGRGSSSLRLEASWDSSRHEKLYLNRITPEKERVYVTLSVVVEVWHCWFFVSLLNGSSSCLTARNRCLSRRICACGCTRGTQNRPPPSRSGRSSAPRCQTPARSHRSSSCASTRCTVVPADDMPFTPRQSEANKDATEASRAALLDEALSSQRLHDMSLLAEHQRDLARQWKVASVRGTIPPDAK